MVKYLSSISWAKEGKTRSLKTTVPREIADLLDLSPDFKIAWDYNTENRSVTIAREKKPR